MALMSCLQSNQIKSCKGSGKEEDDLMKPLGELNRHFLASHILSSLVFFFIGTLNLQSLAVMARPFQYAIAVHANPSPTVTTSC